MVFWHVLAPMGRSPHVWNPSELCRWGLAEVDGFKRKMKCNCPGQVWKTLPWSCWRSWPCGTIPLQIHMEAMCFQGISNKKTVSQSYSWGVWLDFQGIYVEPKESRARARGLHFLEVLLQETEIAPGDNIALLGLGAQWPHPRDPRKMW